jgi:N-acetylglucosamine-6-sulfatase
VRKRIGAVAIALLIAVGFGAARASAQPPNVIMVMLDDANATDAAFMPNVQSELAAHGTTFANSFVNLSSCCPSRATYFTGRYAHNTGVTTSHRGYSLFDPTYTLATWLHGAGYRTGLVGKYLNGYGKRDPLTIPPGWDDWNASPTPTEPAVFDYDLSENGTLVHYGLGESHYKGTVITDRALDFLRSTPTTQPFYLNVAYQVPHHGAPDYSKGVCQGTAQPDPHDIGAHADVPLPMDPSFNEADVSDKPAAISSLPLIGSARIDKITTRYRCRLDSLLSADRGVNRIVDELASEGRLANTLILFPSDNGLMAGQHRVTSGKLVPYEPSIRVPLIARGPGFAQGATVSAPAVNADYAPTFLRAAGVAPSGHDPDGVPLQDVAAGLYSDRDLPIEAYASKKHDVPFHGVRTPSYVYVEYSDGERELYDLAADPYELHNRAGDPRYATTEAWLADRTEALATCAGNTCRLSGDPPPPSSG